MENYLNSVKSLFKDWKVATGIIVLTIARIVYGWSWLNAGIHKLGWLSDGELNSQGKVQGLIEAIGPNAGRFDPLGINKSFAWVADNIFLSMPALTDFLVVILEILIGLFILIGFQVFWSAFVATFLCLQFIAAGSANNFGYIWTNLAFMKWAKYTEVLGVSGILRARKGKAIVDTHTTTVKSA